MAIGSKIVTGLKNASDSKTKAWFSNYVKNTVWFGCKSAVIKSVVKDVICSSRQSVTERPSKRRKINSPVEFLGDAIYLLQREECDAKLAGMILLQLHTEKDKLASSSVLARLAEEVLSPDNFISDWSTTDWFSLKVLETMWRNGDHALAREILAPAHVSSNSLWHRRASVVAFVNWYKYRDCLPATFAQELVDACEQNLLASPDERFTQTGVSWVLRYILVQTEKDERTYAADMVYRHSALWTREAKKSLVEKMPKASAMRTKILKLGDN